MTAQSLRPDPDIETISPGLTVLLATACGIVVANIYYVQPLIGPIARDYSLSG